jgi:dipeptidyl aminopeptidase/acylaminoacyl peptidase
MAVGLSAMATSKLVDELLNLPGLASCEVSPDGRWVAWTWFRVGPAADVFLAPTDGSAKPVQITKTGNDTFVTGWTRDGKSVLVEEDNDGDERTVIYKVDIDKPLDMVRLTDKDPPYFLRGGHLSASGKWIFYGANYDFSAHKEIEPTWIFRQDLETDGRKVLAKPIKPGYGYPHVNNQDEFILYARKDLDPSGRQIWLVDINGANDHEVLNVGPSAKVEASWFPDGKRAVVLAENKSYRRAGVWNRETEKIKWLIDDPSRNIEGAFVPEGSDQIVLTEVRNAKEHALLVDPESGKEQKLADVDGTLIPLAPIPGKNRWVVRYYSSQQPSELLSVDFAKLKDSSIKEVAQLDPISITRVWERTPIHKTDLAKAQEFRWKSTDGQEIHGWLYRVPNPRGTVVCVHGGPTGHSEDALDIEIQLLTAQGFNVLDPNYRGSTGYGLDFQEAIKKEGWGGREQDDIRTGIEALIQSGIAQKGKVGITGTSYGGYSSWHAITHWSPDVVAAAAPICGMTDLVVDYDTTRPDLRPYSEEMMGGSPAQVPTRYQERSPINYVKNIKGKLLIVQGLQDPNVTPENVTQVEQALKSAGVAYEKLTFDDEGHGISKPRNQKTLYLRLGQFFANAFGAAGGS